MALAAESGISLTSMFTFDGVVLVAQGELDRVTAPTFLRGLGQALQTGCSRVNVDLSGITFADVGGHRAMLQFADCCRRLGVTNVWVCPSSPVQLLWRVVRPPAGVVVDEPLYEGETLSSHRTDPVAIDEALLTAGGRR